MERMINFFIPNKEYICEQFLNNETINGFVSLKKSVRFNNKVHIYLIPSIDEYCDIRNLLWYHDTDYVKFKREFSNIHLIYNYKEKNLISYE